MSLQWEQQGMCINTWASMHIMQSCIYGPVVGWLGCGLGWFRVGLGLVSRWLDCRGTSELRFPPESYWRLSHGQNPPRSPSPEKRRRSEESSRGAAAQIWTGQTKTGTAACRNQVLGGLLCCPLPFISADPPACKGKALGECSFSVGA